ncbi:MAG: ethanolamine ammonia-lyase reactivating factor EutA [Ferruginibacter sp.]|nr:ethanolamine ammonia-lyase reactivating factor EutA [Bacteroidota bacterium]MCW5917139.1 ethanolamine ammonia-lyase reactivating factor EutA [Ferruginibacter sp.]
MILAAIDIGSNAARLLISEVTSNEEGKTYFNKLNLIRVPLRLGFDVFETRRISEEKQLMFLKTIQAFRLLMEAYQVDAVKACATSAMRDAENGMEIMERIQKETGVQINIISGDMEAGLVYETHAAENLDKDHNYLYIDVGGGSTEILFFSKGKMQDKISFNIGTIRLLKNKVKESDWETLKDSVKAITKGSKDILAIGSGGNINKIFSLSKKKEGKPLHIDLLRDYYREFESTSLPERIIKYNLRADRADVIVPALSIYINVMRWAGADEIYIPKIGLADGLIRHLWEEINSKKA